MVDFKEKYLIECETNNVSFSISLLIISYKHNVLKLNLCIRFIYKKKKLQETKKKNKIKYIC